MNRLQLRALLDDVKAGVLAPELAQDRLLQYLRQAPFEDLGFARVDHHRNVRQGFPEVVFGLGKTPQQIAAISERIVAAGHNLLVTRTTP
jgi:pyridinium-3,5-biscarboxylic acid mononucleotide synthase